MFDNFDFMRGGVDAEKMGNGWGMCFLGGKGRKVVKIRGNGKGLWVLGGFWGGWGGGRREAVGS